MEIHVLQGERPFAKDNKSLGVFLLKGIPPARRGIPKINVTFQLDVNGLLSVSARDEQTGIEQSITIEGASILARDEVNQMIQEAEKNASLDKSKKSLVNVTYEFDNLLCKTQEFINSTSLSSDSIEYKAFKLSLTQAESLYLKNSFQELSSKALNEVDYLYKALLLQILSI